MSWELMSYGELMSGGTNVLDSYKLVNPKFGTQKVISTVNLPAKRGQICHKTVIYKSLGSLVPVHLHLGQMYQIKQFFLRLPYLKSYIDSKLYDYSDFLPQPLGNDFKLSTNIFEKPVH